MRDYCISRKYTFDEKEPDKQWLIVLRETFEVVEKEMLRMNAALAYSASFNDLSNPGKAGQLRSARNEFLSLGKEFEKREMW